MGRSRSLYVKVDEEILSDPDIQELIDKKGYEGFGVYIALLTLMRRYERSCYMIPCRNFSVFSRNFVGISEKKLKSIIAFLENLGILHHSLVNGEEYILSPRRQRELLAQDRVRQKQSEGGRKGMEKRYT